MSRRFHGCAVWRLLVGLPVRAAMAAATGVLEPMLGLPSTTARTH